MHVYKQIIVISAVVLSIASVASAATYVDIEENSVYQILSRLEAEGVITSGLLDTRPISRKEAFRLLHEAESSHSSSEGFVKSLVQSLRDRLGPETSGQTIRKPIDTVYATYVHTNAEVHALQYGAARENEQPLNVNNNGDLYARGANERAGFISRLEDWGPLSIELNPEYRHPDTPFTGEDFVTKKAYAVFDLGWDIVLGQDSQWWGPGYHGALLLTNNAEPFTMLKLANPTPVRLPWILDSLGPFRCTFFLTNLEKARAVPKPYLYGLRFDFKPFSNFEIGLEKTALLGGRNGRKEDLHTWLESFYGANNADNSWTGQDPGDQRAGLDFKLTIPWKAQPMQIYVEADGEDEYHNLPNLWAFVGGVYLPRILGAERFDLRLEYATTRGRVKTPYTWYTHGIYTSYTYKGNIIGHHIGTDSDDLFAELSYRMPERNGRVFLSFDREKHNFYVEGSRETLDDITTGVELSLTRRVDLTARYGRGRLKNQGNAPGGTMQLTGFSLEFAYNF